MAPLPGGQVVDLTDAAPAARGGKLEKSKFAAGRAASVGILAGPRPPCSTPCAAPTLSLVILLLIFLVKLRLVFSTGASTADRSRAGRVGGAELMVVAWSRGHERGW